MWWLGDWWAYGEHSYGDRAKAADGIDYAFGTLANAGSVCRSIETSRRREVLSFTHHREVAGLPEEAQEELLAEAVVGELSVRELRKAVQDYKAACTALAEAHAIDEVKEIKDKAVALQLYAKQKNDKQLEIFSAEIRFRARVRLGELSKELEKAPSGRASNDSLPNNGKSKKETLKQAGISTSEANRCEQLAEIPAKEREKEKKLV